jgi:hypothetical protein
MSAREAELEMQGLAEHLNKHADFPDLDRCFAAWARRDNGMNCPSRSLSYVHYSNGRRLVELHNVKGHLATYSVTPKRVTLLEPKG